MLVGIFNQPDDTGGLCFAEDIFAVGLDGALTDEEHVGYAAVAVFALYHANDLYLAVGKVVAFSFFF